MEQVTRLIMTLGTADAYGDATETWADGDTYDCQVWPRPSTEMYDPGRAQVITGLTFGIINLPEAVRFSPRDRVRARGQVWEVLAEPAVYRTDTKRVDIIDLLAVEG